MITLFISKTVVEADTGRRDCLDQKREIISLLQQQF